MHVFTVPFAVILLDISPSLLSFAVAPCSVYLSPTFKVIFASPFNLIVGASLFCFLSLFDASVCSVQYVLGGYCTDVDKFFHKYT